MHTETHRKNKKCLCLCLQLWQVFFFFFRFSGHCLIILTKMLSLQQNYVTGFLYTGSTEVIHSLNKRVYFRKIAVTEKQVASKRRSLEVVCNESTRVSVF